MNRLKTIAAAFFATIAVAGCATSYQQRGFSGGFSETQLAENVFEVRFSGNGYTSSERASDFALLRSAELSLERGFRYFVVDDNENDRQIAINTVTTSSGANTYSTSKPGARKVIVCFKEKPDWTGVIYEARFVVQSIRGKYEIEPQ
ncbi:MAG: hypothetical protein OXU71_05650 [Gammaproteobacteria bacterium]|nr:hypothetical protein [Gammaproteobacteria bacterium]